MASGYVACHTIDFVEEGWSFNMEPVAMRLEAYFKGNFGSKIFFIFLWIFAFIYGQGNFDLNLLRLSDTYMHL